MTSTKKAPTHRQRKNRLLLGTTVMMVLLFIGINFMQSRPPAQTDHQSASSVPAWVMQHGPDVAEAYAFAAEHQDVLKYMACYCGCENHGHTSNATCYVKDIGPDGKLQWDSHAAT